MKGNLSTDVVSIGGVAVNTQGFAEATYMDPFFSQVTLDGLLGLGYLDLAAGGITPVFDNMGKNLDSNVFSVYLDSSAGSTKSKLVLGGTDPNLFAGNIFYTPVLELQNTYLYYSVELADLKINGKSVTSCTSGQTCIGIVDTGTSLIIGPTDDINNILSTLGNSCSDLSKLPNIEITIGTVVLTLSPQIYVIGSGRNCGFGFSTSDSDLWILGDSFMRQFYTVFDRDANTIGFAALNNALATEIGGSSYSSASKVFQWSLVVLLWILF